jgi:phospholipase/carboxylesterase
MNELDVIEWATGPEPTTCVIVLHGLGADGNDFVPMAQAMDLSTIGSVRYVFPHAPVMPVTINNGMRMRAWYDIMGFDLVRREDETGLRRSLASIQGLLHREHERGIPAHRTVLAGFSQGCAMSLMAGLRHTERLAGIAGMSGYLPLADTTAAERSLANAHTPVFLAHGLHDDIVAIDRGRASRDLLAQIGQPVQWHEYPMAHTVSMEEVAHLRQWLLQVLAKA